MQGTARREPRSAERRHGIVDLRTHPEPFVTVAALARYWCVSVDTVYRDIAKGALRVYRVGSSGTIRIRLEDARAYGRPDEAEARSPSVRRSA